jgi:hypothetical protein
VTVPFRCAWTEEAIVATPMNSVPAKRTPPVPPLAVAMALFPPLRVFASTTTFPDPPRLAAEPTVVSMSAPDPMLADAREPERPITETPKT